ncbi:uncharacterized protein LOC133464387 [Cololabis saira]|uniref:uncharacterized protein LOC133464387 n=1 Tax=Cololabis saira TaxID=129043 RepID=UPI002AD50DDF|nr:uncharacterized protein LOC133464387 [Cololabis saira]
MEQQQMLGILGSLFDFMQVYHTVSLQQFAQYEQQTRQRTVEGIAFYLRRMRRQRMRRRALQRERVKNIHMLSRLYRCRARITWARPRTSTWWDSAINTWDEREWQRNFRMSKTSFLHLCDILRPNLTRQRTRYRCPLAVELRLAICLWRLATNMEFRSISHLFGVGISTACSVTQQVVTAINKIMKPHYIKAPSEPEVREIVQGFRDRWGLLQVAGVIDATHIGILAPAEDPTDYYNRRSFYSVVLQGVVDDKMKFWDINVGWPGKLHDARVLVSTSMYSRGQNCTLFPDWTERLGDVDVPLHIVGDAAYPLLPWLLKPFPEGGGLTEAQTHFNHRLWEARVTVERAFGRLKGRWQCLLRRCDAHISLISHIISACCVLHNFCEIANEDWEDEDLAADVDDIVDLEIGDQANYGGQIRDALCAHLAQ